MTSHSPFIINLETHPHGYTFHSLQQLPSAAPSKSKKGRTPPPRPTHNKITNRLIKEIGLTSEIPPVIPEQHIYSSQVPNIPEELPRAEPDYQEEEQIDCEIKRQTELPNTPAHWFSLKDIHQKEIQQFPEFFNEKSYKTPQLYQAYRNFMVQAYRQNPRRYLSFIACRRVLKGDVNTLLKIYNFLTDQGLLNYTLGTDGNYDFKDIDVAQESQLGKKPQSCLKKLPQKPQLQDTSELDTDNLTVTVINKNFSRSYRVYCDNCKLICGIVWYTSAADQDRAKNICLECFNSMDKEQSSGYTKTDITKKVEASKETKTQNKTNWGLEDNIRLLDFMGSAEGKSWEDIEAYFEGKKTREDIILQFMQFPISNFDPYDHQKSLKHQKTEYKHDEHIKQLWDLYEASPYAVKKEENKTQTSFRPSPSLTKFRSISSMFLSKIHNKIEQLRTIETVWEETNLEMKERPLVNRLKAYKPGQNSELAEQSESVINQDE